jgi:hypothetical protein
MSRIMTTSEIANFKMIGDVIELRECYQCGGETLGPVVKHSVRDSTYCPSSLLLPVTDRPD